MFDPVTNPLRFDKPPTEAELWAGREAKSETMAADLLNGAESSATPPTATKPHWVARLARLLFPGGEIAIAFYWLR